MRTTELRNKSQKLKKIIKLVYLKIITKLNKLSLNMSIKTVTHSNLFHYFKVNMKDNKLVSVITDKQFKKETKRK